MRSFRDRYLLCRPQGGLNDTLCQIGICWNYAFEFGRTLVIDTRNSGLRAQFSDFFAPRRNSPRLIFNASDHVLETLNTLSCYPPELGGKLHRLDLAQLHSLNYVFKHDVSVPLTFDFSEDYAHDVLVHERWGGGRASYSLLEKIRLSPNLRPVILERIKHLGEGYSALHVRNTDIQTNYKELFQRIAPEVKGKRLLVCSDDAAVVRYARSYFHDSEVLVTSEIPDMGGTPLHGPGGDKLHAIDAIVDLIALGRSEKLYFSISEHGLVSGFTHLAAHLWRNKYVIHALLQQPGHRLQVTKWRVKYHRRRAKKYMAQLLAKVGPRQHTGVPASP